MFLCWFLSVRHVRVQSEDKERLLYLIIYEYRINVQEYMLLYAQFRKISDVTQNKTD